MLHDCIAKKAHSAAFQPLTIEYMHTLPFDPVEVYTPSGHYYLWQLILVDISKLETNLIFHTRKKQLSFEHFNSSKYSPGSHSRSAVADLGFLEGGFRFGRITAVAYIVTSCQARAAEVL